MMHLERRGRRAVVLVAIAVVIAVAAYALGFLR
jgi:hypothetical protein